MALRDDVSPQRKRNVLYRLWPHSNAATASMCSSGTSITFQHSAAPSNPNSLTADNDSRTYNTCGAGCRYCYARRSERATERNLRRYDPSSPLLCDELGHDDVVYQREMRSLFVANVQESLF